MVHDRTHSGDFSAVEQAETRCPQNRSLRDQRGVCRCNHGSDEGTRAGSGTDQYPWWIRGAWSPNWMQRSTDTHDPPLRVKADRGKTRDCQSMHWRRRISRRCSRIDRLIASSLLKGGQGKRMGGNKGNLGETDGKL